MSKIKKRLSEPTTYAGAALVLTGLDKMFNLHGVPQVAEIVTQAGAAAATGQGVYIPLLTLIAGLAAMFMPEKGKK